jgi:hypothetical protein
MRDAANSARQGGVCTQHGAIRYPDSRQGRSNPVLGRGTMAVTSRASDGAVRRRVSRGCLAKSRATPGGEADEPSQPVVEEYEATSLIGGRGGGIGI